MNKLLEFRTVYLRAVAEAWANPDFGVKLKEKPIEALRDLNGPTGSDYEWPWPKIDLKIVDSKATTWNPAEKHWEWPDKLQESLTIRLPLDPPKSGALDEPTRILAEYYRTNAVIFEDAESLKDPDPTRLMPDHEGFEEFQVAVLAAIARAWADPAFKEKLLYDGGAALKECTRRDPRDKHPWELPWKLHIVVENDPEFKWRRDPEEREGNGAQKPTPTVILTLCLPPKPEDAKSSALALAMYNAAGAEYPFTCCG